MEKVVAKEFFQYCENFYKLYPGQMGDQKERLVIDIFATLVHIVKE